MPATPLVIHTADGRLALQLAEWAAGLPVRLRRTQTEEELLAAISQALFPIVLFDADLDPGRLADWTAAAAQRSATIIVWGRPSEPLGASLRELGVMSFVPKDVRSSLGRALVERLVQRAQERVNEAGGRVFGARPV